MIHSCRNRREHKSGQNHLVQIPINSIFNFQKMGGNIYAAYTHRIYKYSSCYQCKNTCNSVPLLSTNCQRITVRPTSVVHHPTLRTPVGPSSHTNASRLARVEPWTLVSSPNATLTSHCLHSHPFSCKFYSNEKNILGYCIYISGCLYL